MEHPLDIESLTPWTTATGNIMGGRIKTCIVYLEAFLLGFLFAFLEARLAAFLVAFHYCS
jgi:hypothetical protein